MDLEAFLQKATAFLDARFARREGPDEKFVWGEGDDAISVIPEAPFAGALEAMAPAREFLRARFDAGFSWISGDPAFGGRGLPDELDAAYQELEGGYETPSTSVFGIGTGMIAPTIAAHGTAGAKGRYLRGLHRGDLVACQLFSEPGAGSDLAGLQCRAERVGDTWVVSGQKVWSSGAHVSDVGEIICRTDPSASRHKGITAFMVDMRAPGVDVRPLRQMTGGAAFNEVFLTDVRIPDDDRLGDVGGGWTVTQTTLLNERSLIGNGSTGLPGWTGVASGERLIQMLRHLGRAEDAVLRQELSRVYCGFRTATLTVERGMANLARTGFPGPELSVAKLALAQNVTALAELVARMLGPRLVADTGEWGTWAWNEVLLGAPALHLAGGTDEVLRNVVGEKVLGLPRDPKP